VIFGHAIYESLALGVAPAVAAAVVISRDRSQPDPVIDADISLARCIDDSDRLRSPRELRRVDVSEAESPSAVDPHRHGEAGQVQIENSQEGGKTGRSPTA
jgi:hypothetical protein